MRRQGGVEKVCLSRQALSWTLDKTDYVTVLALANERKHGDRTSKALGCLRYALRVWHWEDERKPGACEDGVRRDTICFKSHSKRSAEPLPKTKKGSLR